jgi:hypothetical protein
LLSISELLLVAPLGSLSGAFDFEDGEETDGWIMASIAIFGVGFDLWLWEIEGALCAEL